MPCFSQKDLALLLTDNIRMTVKFDTMTGILKGKPELF